jgi:transposase
MDDIRGFLSPQERHELRAVLHRSRHTAQEHGRAHAILLLDAGIPLLDVAKLLFLDEQTILNFFSRYQAGRLECLLHDGRHGKASKLTDLQKEQLREHVDSHLYTDCSLILSHILLEYNISYSLSGVKKLLHELDFVYKKPKHVPGKADREAQAEFVRRFRVVMADKSPETPVYFTDAVHPTHNSSPSYGWIKRGSEKELIANSGRQRLNIHGALNAETHDVITLPVESVNAAATVELLKEIDAAHPNAPSILVIADNAGYYHAEAVTGYLASGQSRIQLWFLPPYSPNLNLIERVWKFFRKKVMNNRYYATFREFSEEALMFFDCLSDYADELRTLLTHNFQLFDSTPKEQVRMAY